jgi:hypothetical protein
MGRTGWAVIVLLGALAGCKKGTPPAAGGAEATPAVPTPAGPSGAADVAEGSSGTAAAEPGEAEMPLKVREDVADRVARYARVQLGADLSKLSESERGVLHELRRAADLDRKSTRLNSSHNSESRMPSSA